MEDTRGFVSAKDALAALEQYQGCFFPHSVAVKIINQLSREDVEPVVHARWIYQDGEHICSHCKGAILYELDDQGNAISEDWPWCAKCGAKMEEKVEYADERY